MVGIRPFALLSLAAFASAQSMESLDPCGQQCYTTALNNAGTFACGANDMNCLCRVPDFSNAINDCASAACPPGYAPTVSSAAAAMCATATLPAGAAAPTSTTPPATTPAPTTAAAPTSTSVSSSEVPSTSSTSTTLATSTTSATAKTESPSSTAPASSTSSSSAVTKVASATTSAATAAATSEAAAADSSKGMSEAAKIGVGVGVGAVVIALVAVAVCLFMRRRTNQSPPPAFDRYKISHPMPSNELAYTQNNNSEYDIGRASAGELEMKSYRYEDMLPRQQQVPREVV